jgi:hypothetical protein
LSGGDARERVPPLGVGVAIIRGLSHGKTAGDPRALESVSRQVPWPANCIGAEQETIGHHKGKNPPLCIRWSSASLWVQGADGGLMADG